MRAFGIEEANAREDATASMRTGIHGQTLHLDGWFASHADTGVPGPHVRLVANGVNGAVLKTSQIPELIDCLNLVAERIDRQWEREGSEYLRTFGEAPDDHDSEVILPSGVRNDELVDLPTAEPPVVVDDQERDEARRQRRAAKREVLELVHSHASAVLEIVLAAEDDNTAAVAIAHLLGVPDETALDLITHLQFRELTKASRRQQRSDN